VKRAIVVTCLLLAIAGGVVGAWWILRRSSADEALLLARFDRARQLFGLRTEGEAAGLTVSGFIEADEVEISAEVGGRVVAIHADEGDSVKKEQILVQLDDSLLVSQIKVAQADLALAQAALDQVKAGVRPETLDRARAEVAQARAAQAAAQTAWQDSLELLKNPQELELALIVARGQLEVLRYQEQQAQAVANSGQAARALADESLQLLEDAPVEIPADLLAKAEQERVAATYRSWTAWTELAEAEASRRGVETLLAELAQQKTHPLTLQAQADAAESQVRIAAAAVGMAESQVEGLEIGATPEQLAAAEAQVEIAQAAVQALEVRLEQFVLKAPISGLVLERAVHAGEVALPGAPLLTLADLDLLTLTVYVPESQLGSIIVGEPVSVSVDAYPGRIFPGTIRSLGSQAEFTPRNVQTQEERVNMVFAVGVSLANPDGALKPGMPADVGPISAASGR
jgi:multidrug resistance efflux pump